MSDWKENAIRRRHARDGVIEQRSAGGKNKRERPWIVYYRFREAKGIFIVDDGKWRKRGKYRTKEEAERAAQILERKLSFLETRIDGPNSLA
jgi:hypothetical protein